MISQDRNDDGTLEDQNPHGGLKNRPMLPNPDPDPNFRGPKSSRRIETLPRWQWGQAASSFRGPKSSRRIETTPRLRRGSLPCPLEAQNPHGGLKLKRETLARMFY